MFPPLPYESAFTYLGIINVRQTLKGHKSLKSSYSMS